MALYSIDHMHTRIPYAKLLS